MTRGVRTRFWVEAGAALTCAVLTVVTLITKEWIELLFHVDPDGGSGVLEWGIVLATAALTVLFSVMARRDWLGASIAGA
jgi:hypothetical protein